MNRKSFIRTSALTLGAFAISNQKLFAGFYGEPAWKITMLTDEIGIFNERGGTILFYMGKEGNIVVDCQWPETVTNLIGQLKQKNPQPFELIINTHHHLPCTSGNIAFKDLAKNFIAHENSKSNQIRNAKLMRSENNSHYPNLTYKNTWCEKFGKENICLYNFGAGHTNGDTIVHFEYADIVHMGDLVFNRRHPGIDRTAGASIKNWNEVLNKAYYLFGRKTKFVFGYSGEGHSVVGTKEDLKAFSNYLSQLLIFTENEIKKGKPKKDIIKNSAIPGTPEWRGDGLDRTLAAAFDELTLDVIPE
jgi:glyoxylase-like metal-dependent hydrolase (beta-lactamase superfamily II)